MRSTTSVHSRFAVNTYVNHKETEQKKNMLDISNITTSAIIMNNERTTRFMVYFNMV